MRFAFMGRILQYSPSGLETFLSELLRSLARLQSPHELYVLLATNQVLPEDLRQLGLRGVTAEAPLGGPLNKLGWDHLSVGRTCKQLRIDALYAPAHVRPLLAPCPVVVMVPDMMYHRLPHLWPLSDRLYFQLAVNMLTPRADKIITLSNSARSDILSILHLPSSKVEVCYPGVPDGFGVLDQSVTRTIKAKYALDRPFALFVGRPHPRKNRSLLIDVFSQVEGEVPHELVLIGPTSWRPNEVNRDPQMLASRRIRLLGEVPRTELAALYNMASAFVFPVEYEGFGLPVLEALACGCPTITTTGGSLPEVAGDAALLVPPGDRDALRNALIRLLTDEALRQTLGRRALERAQTFSATASAQRTLDILAAAARHQSPGASGDE